MSDINYVAITRLATGIGIGSFITSLAIIGSPDDVVGVATGGFAGSVLCFAFVAGAAVTRLHRP